MSSFTFIVFSVLYECAIATTHRLTTFKARLHCVLWPAQFGRNWSWARDDRKWPRPRRDRDVSLPRPRRWQFFSRRDREETLVRLETSRPRPQPCQRTRRLRSNVVRSHIKENMYRSDVHRTVTVNKAIYHINYDFKLNFTLCVGDGDADMLLGTPKFARAVETSAIQLIL